MGEQYIDLSIFFLTTACESTLSKISAAIHIKKKKERKQSKTQQTGNRGKLPQNDKEHPCLPQQLVFRVVFLLVFFFCHSHRYVVVSHCCNLQFPNDKWYSASFHVLNNHLQIFLGEVCVQIFCAFFNWVVYYFNVEFRDFVYYIQVLCQICVLQMFSLSLWLVFSYFNDVFYFFSFIFISWRLIT